MIMDKYILKSDDLKCITDQLLYKSGNNVVDDFIRYASINGHLKASIMEFVNYDQFKDIEFINEGGVGKIYRATWINGPINNWDKKKLIFRRRGFVKVVLKKLNNSENITYKKLNEVNIPL